MYGLNITVDAVVEESALLMEYKPSLYMVTSILVDVTEVGEGVPEGILLFSFHFLFITCQSDPSSVSKESESPLSPQIIYVLLGKL